MLPRHARRPRPTAARPVRCSAVRATAVTGCLAAVTAGLALLPVQAQAVPDPAQVAQVGPNDVRISQQPVPGGIENTAVAYDPGHARYLVVWQGLSMDDGAGNAKAVIYGQLVDARTGNEIGGNDLTVAQLGASNDANTDALNPAVVWNPTRREFVVAFEGATDTDPGTLTQDTNEVYAQRVDDSGALVGGQVRLSDMAGSPASTSYDATEPPDIAYDATDDEYLVVWRGDANGITANNENEVFARRVGYAGGSLTALGGAMLQLSDVGGANLTNGQFDAREPAVAWNSVEDQYLVSWQADDSSDGGVDNAFRIWGQRVSAAGAEIGTNDFLVSTVGAPTDTETETFSPEVAYNPDRDEYLVVWEGDGANGTAGSANDFEIWGQRLAGPDASAVGGNSRLSQMGTTGSSAYTAQHAAVAYDTDNAEYLVTWTGDDNTGGLVDDEQETFAERLSGTLGTVAAQTPISDMGPAGVAHVAPTASAVAYSERSVDDYLVVWAGENPGVTAAGESEVWGQLVAPAADLRLTTSVSSTAPAAGDQVTYTLSYLNAGPDEALDTAVTDVLPAALTDLSWSSTGPTPTARTGTPYVWDLPRLASGQSGTITVTGTVAANASEGTVVSNTASIASGTMVADATGDNSGTTTLTVDNPPTIRSITRAGSSPSNASSVSFLVTFDQSVSGVTLSDFAVRTSGLVGATSTGISGTGATRTVTVATGSGDGTLRLDLVSGVGIVDTGIAGGKALVASLPFTGASYAVDRTAPTVALSSAAPDPTSSAPIPVTITFSEDVTGLAVGDIVVTGGTAENLAGSGTTYTADLVPYGQGAVTASVAAGAATDAAGNASTASEELSVRYDSVRPTATLSSSAPDPTRHSPIPFAVTFGEDVTGLTAGDITATNGTVGDVQGSADSYTFEVTPAGQGTVTVRVAGDAAHDAAGNGSEASAQVTRIFDGAAPTLTLGSTAGDPTNAEPVPVTAQFDEPVTGFTADDLTVAGATVAGFTRVDGDTYTFDLDNPAEGLVTVDVAAGAAQDAAGNDSVAALELTRTFDSVRPSATLTSTAAEPSNSAPLPVHIELSEPVTGLTADDLVVVNGTVGTLTGSGSSYDVTVQPTPGLQGVVTVTLPADSASDAAGNGNTAGDLARTLDLVAPGVTVEQAAGQPDPATVRPIRFTVGYSEPVTGFTAGDVAVSGTAGATTAALTGSGADYTVEVSGMTGSGTVRVAVPAGAAVDAAGNPNTASTSTDDTVTFNGNTAPTIAVAPGGRCVQQPRSGMMRFRVADAEQDRLTVRARSSNLAVVPARAITIDGSRVSVAPLAAARTRRATVTLTVSDGRLSASTAIHVLVGTLRSGALVGTGGSDLVFGRNGDDLLDGRGGIDLLCAGRGHDVVRGGPGADVLYGGDQSDVLRGGAGDDVLHGGRGDDRLTGNAGADLFLGGRGRDVLTDVRPAEGDVARP